MTTLVLGVADTLIESGVNLANSLATNAITGGSGGSAPRVTQGPRLTEMSGLSSTEGAPIPRVYGRARVGGQLIWATRFEEIATTTTTVERQPKAGGKSFGGSSKKVTTNTRYGYVANLAVGLCEGPIAFVRRVWADTKELDLTTLTFRVHRGEEDQVPDPLIVAKRITECKWFKNEFADPTRTPHAQFRICRRIRSAGIRGRSAECMDLGARISQN